MNRLRVARSAGLVLITAPAGYGKTTLVADWARRDGRPFAWCSIAPGETGTELVERLAFALACVLPERAPDLEEFAAAKPGDNGVARLGALIASTGLPVVIVVDDVQRLDDGETSEALTQLEAELPEDSQLVLVSRVEPPLPLARLRAQGHLVELDVEQLRFSDREAAALLSGAGVDVRRLDTVHLNQAVEGWPAGLQLAALALRSSRAVAGDDVEGERIMFEYLRSDVLAGLPEEDVRFLTRSSVLDRLGGPLCDFVTETEGSPALLDRLERSNLFLLPLDRERKWFRIHAIFRHMLAEELELREPGVASELRKRASDWCRTYGDPQLALEYARRSGDSERLIELIDGSLLPFGPSGAPATIASWLEPLDDDAVLLAHPRLAAIGALAWALTGRAETADRWADAALRAGEDDEAEGLSSPWSALLHSLTSPHDAGEMAAEAAQALEMLPLDSAWRGPALLTLGAAHALAGDPASAEAALRHAAAAASASGAAPIESAALGLQSLVAAQRGAWRRSDILAGAARKVVDDATLGDEVTTLFALAANARSALRRGAWPTVRADLDAADRLLPRLTYASGSLSLLLRTELASVHLALGESDRAARLLDEVDEVFARRPGVGVLRRETRELRAQVVASAGRTEGRAATLTSAELRLLPLLTTHLSFREIAEQLYVSRNTVKTQAISVYRKLGVSSRGEAVAHASEVGLVAATDDREPV